MSRNCNKMKIIIKNTCVIELISISLHYQIKTKQNEQLLKKITKHI